MARKRRSRKRRDADRLIVRGMIVALLCAAALGGAVAWLQTPSGRMAMADRGFPASEDWARDRLGGVLENALLTYGIPADSLVIEPATDVRVGVFRFRTGRELTALNLALTLAVEDAGGTVHFGQRIEDPDGDTLELRVGTRLGITHRLIASPTIVPPPPEELPSARIAIVIDDLGYNFNRLTRRALALPGPITFAVLPELRFSARVLTEIGRTGHQAFLHMPMEAEPSTGYTAGEPQIRVGMEVDRIRYTLQRCLDGMPGVVGVNNHMGSRATQSRPEMDAVMQVLAERGLVFLDSQTTPRSVAHVAASAHGVPHLRNDIFLDANEADVDLVLARLETVVERARRRGWAVAIGHVNSPLVEALERFLPELAARGVELAPLEELIHDRTS